MSDGAADGAGELLVVASHNSGKVVEIEALLKPFGVATVGAAALGLPEPEETGATFEENAALKAREAAERSGLPALSDNSGLVVPALGGAPGIYSARWAGPGRDFRAAMERVRRELDAKDIGDRDRSAHFVAVLALAWPDGEIATFRGEVAWPAGLAAARRAGFRLRPDFRPRRVRHDLRRDRSGREAPNQPPRAGFREAGTGVFLSDKTPTPTLPRLRERGTGAAATSHSLPRLRGRDGVGAEARDPLAIYIHWPFCRSKCPYCDFNSHVRERIDEQRWTRALLADLDHQAALAPDREIVSVFFGGGTPSLMPPATVGALIERVRALWPAASDLEITLEANPNSAEADRFAAFARAGVNRLSLGIQALDPEALRFLGRRHDRDEAIAAIRLARDTFPRYSFDLIYARPGQSLAAWDSELGEALALAGEHLSLYQLTIEPGTAFGNRAMRGETLAADEETAAALFELTQDRLGTAGLPAYEISNHARPGAECRHNLAYWRYQDYLGIGPGAHGRVTREGGKIATAQLRLPRRGSRRSRAPARRSTRKSRSRAIARSRRWS